MVGFWLTGYTTIPFVGGDLHLHQVGDFGFYGDVEDEIVGWWSVSNKMRLIGIDFATVVTGGSGSVLLFLHYQFWTVFSGMGRNEVPVPNSLQFLFTLETITELSYYLSQIHSSVTVTKVTKVPKFQSLFGIITELCYFSKVTSPSQTTLADNDFIWTSLHSWH